MLEFDEFVSWLEYKYEKRTNREVIDYIYQMIINKLKSMKLKITSDKLKNELVAFIYKHSRVSKMKIEGNDNDSEYSEEKDYYEIYYLNDIRELYQEIKEYIEFYRFNILDSQNIFTEINFTNFIFQNIKILLPEEIDEEDNREDDIYDYY